MREHEDDGEGAVEQEADRRVGDVEILQEAVEDAVAAEDCFPGVAANEIADPERDDDELIEEFFACACMERQVVGERIAEQQGTESDGGGDAHACGKGLRRRRDCDEVAVIVEIPLMNDEAVAHEPEAVGEHEGVGEEQEKADPEQRR